MDPRLQDEAFPIAGLRVSPPAGKLLASAAILLSAIVATACGARSEDVRRGSSGASAATGSVAARSAPAPSSNADPSEHDGDGDIDRLTQGPYDTDNDAIPGFGQPAGKTDRRAILALVGRYYTAAAAGQGARACSMLFASTAERVVEEHHRGNGPASLQGDACPQIMSRLFEQRHRELAEDITGYRVLVVEVRGNRGYALVRFPAKRELRENQVLVHREHGGWKMAVPLDNGAQ